MARTTFLLCALVVAGAACDQRSGKARRVDDLSATPTKLPVPEPESNADLVGRWTIEHTVSSTNGVASKPQPPLMATAWVFGADGSFKSPQLSGRYQRRGNTLTLPGFGEGQDYRIVSLDDNQLVVVFDMTAGTTKIKNTTTLKREKAATVDPAASVQPAAATLDLPTRAMTDLEKKLVGTWVARVGTSATRSKKMAGSKVFNLGKDPTKSFTDKVVDAVDDKALDSCIWLELYDDFSGFRSGCVVLNGEPSALDDTNPMTGQKTGLGSAFSWRIGKDGAMQIVLARPYLVAKNGKDVEFRQWHLRFTKGGVGKFPMQESFPEHNFELPVLHTYEIFSGSFLKKKSR